MRIPADYNRLMPYLILKGTSNFRKFMTDVFQATEHLLVPTADGDNIMHGEIKIGDATIMFAEATDEFSVMNAGLYIYVEDTDATYEKALESGAEVIPGQEPSIKEYGKTAGVKDPFGNVWWITQHIEKG